ncbi:TPA: hypothetical protein ACN31Q_000462 [Vibrio campbellii]
MEIEKKIMLEKLKRDLINNEENTKAVVVLYDQAKELLSETSDPVEVLNLSDEICFWEERLSKYRFERRRLILKMEKINDF